MEMVKTRGGRVNNSLRTNLCVYKECLNRQIFRQDLSFHLFPQDDERKLQEWIRRCGLRKNWDPKTNQICSDHFKDSDYKGEKKGRFKHLKETALPKDFNMLTDSDYEEMPILFDSRRNVSSTINSKSVSDFFPTSSKKYRRSQGENVPLSDKSFHEETERVHFHKSEFGINEIPQREQNMFKNSELQKQIEKLKSDLEIARRNAQRAEDAYTFTENEMQRIKKKLEQKIITMSEENSETQSKLAAAEARNKQQAEILRQKNDELMELKRITSRRTDSNLGRKELLHFSQRRIELVTQQRDFYRHQLDQYERGMKMFSFPES